MCVQDVVRSWYARLPSIVQNTEQLVTNAEECAEACREGERDKLYNSTLHEKYYISVASLSQDLSSDWDTVWTHTGSRRS